MVSVPTTNRVKNTGTSAISAGGVAGAGAGIGRMFGGNGLGTALGGILGASAIDDNNSRDRMAEVAVFTGIQEMTSGGSGGRSRSQGTM